MKINPIRLFFAWDIPVKVCFVFPIIGPICFAWFAIKPIENLKEPIFIGAALLVLIFGMLLAFLITLLFISILAPFYLLNEKMNGGPFEPGDSVFILTGKHKGKITEVYAREQGHCVRIRLSEKEKEDFTDVYPPSKLLSTQKLNKSAQAIP